jgi:hypothetical protein
MRLLQKASNNIAYLKEGIYGFQGSGKTFTAVKQAIFLWLYIKKLGLDPGPVAMFDTENGSAFAEPEFDRHDIPFFVFRGRAFKDLIAVAGEAVNEGCSILIVDSATHIWRDLVDSYLKRKNRKRLAMHDWGPIKLEWSQFPNLIVNAPIHMFVLGRAGYEYDTVQKDEDGFQSYDTIKTGTKFKAEGEFGFEPSIVFEMTRVRLNDEGVELGKEVGKNHKGQAIRATAKGRAIEKHRAYCVKDRNMDPKTTLDGKYFDFDPSDEESAPFDILINHLKCLNIGGAGRGLDMGDSSDMFDDPDKSRYEYKHQCEITEEKIKEVLILAELDGTSAKAKKQRVEELRKAFGTSSWKEITSMKLAEMQNGHAILANNLGIDLADGGTTEPQSEPEQNAEQIKQPDDDPPPPSNEDEVNW